MTIAHVAVRAIALKIQLQFIVTAPSFAPAK